MDFGESDMERMIRSGIREITESYDETYWRDVRNNNKRPEEFKQDLADAGWLGMMIPEEYGGQGMGLQEVAIATEELSKSGGGRTASNLLSTPCYYGGGYLPEHASEEIKEEWLPRFANGTGNWAIGVTEPEAGMNTTNLDTVAERDGDKYVINGQKMWTTGINTADRVGVLARTLPVEEADSRGHGLSMFLVDPDADGVDYDEIPKDIYHHHPSFFTYFDDVRVHESQILGEEHQGLYQFFAGLNIERIHIAASLYGIGSYVLEKAVDYANERVVFDEPIGAHQAVAHPLADAYADLEAAKLVIKKSAWMYDNNKDQKEVGGHANIANLKAGQAAWDACERAMQTFGGSSIASNMGVAKFWQEVRHQRIAPITEEMIRNHISEHILGLPRSY